MLRLFSVLEIRLVRGVGEANKQGSGGIGISSAKAVIYTLAAGVEYVSSPSRADISAHRRH
jgi:hypothetical protein